MVDIEDFELPNIKDDEVLIATESTLISPGTERAFLLSLPNARGGYPSRPGYSNIGKVVAVGKKVSGFSIGDRVASTHGHTSHFVTSPSRLLKIEPSEALVFFNLGYYSIARCEKSTD